MSTVHIVLVVACGVTAGLVNVVAGAGSLITFPLLVAVGLPPLAANVTNDIGVVPGNVSGVLGVRRGLRAQGALLRSLVPRAVIGSLLGAGILLLVPGAAFAWVAPPLLLAASALTLLQRRLFAALGGRGAGLRTRALHRTVEACSVYGGYFGTGIGLVFAAALGVFVDETPDRLNAVKTVLQLIANGAAGVVFACAAPVRWLPVLVLGLGTLVGGQLGALLARRITPDALRTTTALIGVAASAWLFARQLT